MADVNIKQNVESQTELPNGSQTVGSVRKKEVKKKRKPGKDRGNLKAGKARRRGRKPYPVVVFEEALTIPKGIMQHASGNPVRRLRLLQLLDLNPTGQATRDLITHSNKYGLTEGSYAAEELRLTEKGKLAVDPSTPLRQRRQAGCI